MDMSDKEAYNLLLEVNSDLILDHYKHTEGDLEEAKRLIKSFEDRSSEMNMNVRFLQNSI